MYQQEGLLKNQSYLSHFKGLSFTLYSPQKSNRKTVRPNEQTPERPVIIFMDPRNGDDDIVVYPDHLLKH